jgi:hypothetical protein
MTAKYLFVWLGMVPIAIFNGVLRQYGYGPHLDELTAHQVSTLTGMVLMGLYIARVMRRWPTATARQAWVVGLLWLGMTVGFEFLFGHYVADYSWQRLLADYDLGAGRLWGLFLAWITLAPYLFHRLRG